MVNSKENSKAISKIHRIVSYLDQSKISKTLKQKQKQRIKNNTERLRLINANKY